MTRVVETNRIYRANELRAHVYTDGNLVWLGGWPEGDSSVKGSVKADALLAAMEADELVEAEFVDLEISVKDSSKNKYRLTSVDGDYGQTTRAEYIRNAVETARND